MSSELDRLYRDIISGVGEDPGREGLQDTPQRAARAMQYLTAGYGQTVEEVVNNAIFESDNDEMILVKDIELYSLCEHHLLPFIRINFAPLAITAPSSGIKNATKCSAK